MPSPLSHRLACALTLLTPLAFLACSGQSETSIPVEPPPPPYFGAATPGETPMLFAPEGLKQLTPEASAFEFSPDGRIALVCVPTSDKKSLKIQMSRFASGAWSPLVDAPFAKDFVFCHEPGFTPDGKSLIFTGAKDATNQDLYTVSFDGKTFGTPVALPAPINTPAPEWRGSMAPDGSFYFGSLRVSPADQLNQIFRATKDAAGVWKVELAPFPLNSEVGEGDPCIAPDGRWMVFYSNRSYRAAELYVSFREANGTWGDPIRLGPEFNAATEQYGARLSGDGKFLFFVRKTRAEGEKTWWVSTSAIDKLKPATQPWFGQALPGDAPVTFAPTQLKGLGAWVSDVAFSPDGTQCFASSGTPDALKLQHATFRSGTWSAFVDAPFGTGFSSSTDATFAKDGSTLTFTGTKAGGSPDLWTVPFANQTWGAPVALPAPINGLTVDGPSCTGSDGTVYFSSDRSGVSLIYGAKKDASGSWVVTPLPAAVNSGKGDFGPTLSWNGICLVFSSTREGGRPDLYVSFNLGRGWLPAVKLGKAFNTDADEVGAHFSTNGHHLFFTRRTTQGAQLHWVNTVAIERHFALLQ